MILELILESLRGSAGENPRAAVELAAHTIRERALVKEALVATDGADDPASRWLHAALAENSGITPETADALWARVVDRESRDFPDVLVQRARLAYRRKDETAAAQFLRQAFYCEWDSGTLVRAETLARKVFSKRTPRREIRIALLGNCSTLMLRSAIRMACWRDGLNASIFEPDFGTSAQQILDPDSALYKFRPDFVVSLENWRDVFMQHASAADAGARAADETGRTWDRILSRLDCSIIQILPTRPAFDSTLGLSLRSPSGAARFLDAYNCALVSRAPESVLIIDTAALASRTRGAWEDLKQWTTNRIYPSMEALPALADAVVSNIRYVCGFSSKLVAVDLDNTLWGGVIGEDGLAGIKLGPPSPVGERYQIFQQYLKHLTSRGILLAAVSKNNPADAERVFAEHDACILKKEDFAAFEANWGTKADSLRRIAQNLRLGLDSFVFLDDNPMERSAVLAALPGIVVPNISGEPGDSLAALERFQFFQTSKITDEDRNRNASYQALAVVASSNDTPDELLASLQIQIEAGPVSDVTAARVEQLINKTNQFNLTTRRYTAAEVDELRGAPSNWFFWYRLKDRFADHGLVGIILVKGSDTPNWKIDLWLMSCRVIGRKLEEFMFNSVLKAAKEAGATTLTAEYLPTAKNGLVSNLLPRMGFERIDENSYQLTPGAATEMEIPSGLSYSVAGTVA